MKIFLKCKIFELRAILGELAEIKPEYQELIIMQLELENNINQREENNFKMQSDLKIHHSI